MISVKRTKNRISVSTPIWYGNPVEVIAFMKNAGEWTVATSICFPSDVEKAKVVKEAFCRGFEELQKAMDEDKAVKDDQ